MAPRVSRRGFLLGSWPAVGAVPGPPAPRRPAPHVPPRPEGDPLPWPGAVDEPADPPATRREFLLALVFED